MAVARAGTDRACRPSNPSGQWQWYDAQQDAPGAGTILPMEAMNGWDFFAALLVSAALIPAASARNLKAPC
jgi:hypothetical protein